MAIGPIHSGHNRVIPEGSLPVAALASVQAADSEGNARVTACERWQVEGWLRQYGQNQALQSQVARLAPESTALARLQEIANTPVEDETSRSAFFNPILANASSGGPSGLVVGGILAAFAAVTAALTWANIKSGQPVPDPDGYGSP